MQRSTGINTVTETGCVRAAFIETAVQSMISTPGSTNVLREGTRNTRVITMISCKDTATDIRPDTTTATTAGRYALTFMDWMTATIRIGCPAGTRAPMRTPDGDTLTS